MKTPGGGGEEKLRARIAKVPRARLASLPTPLEECPRLSAALGGPRILIKRDDLTGLALGGNKGRQLEFVMGDVLIKRADVVVVGAGSQSNLCCQVAAAARKLGLDAVLLLARDDKADFRGNIVLDALLGAEIRFVDVDDFREVFRLCDSVAAELAARGRRPYTIDPWSTTGSLAAIAYVNFVIELLGQLREAGTAVDYLFTSATDATPAGVALGLKAIGANWRLVGISPALAEEESRRLIARIATDAAALLGMDTMLSPEEITNLDGYIGGSYGELTAPCLEAMALVAETEGIVLDPVYSGKAMAGLIDHIRTGRIGKGETVVFLHTGGVPLVFAYTDELRNSYGEAIAPRRVHPVASASPT